MDGGGRLDRARRGGHGPRLPDPRATAAVDQAHPGRRRRGGLRVVLPPADGPDHLRREHGGEPAGRAVRVGAGGPRLRRPGPTRPGLLPGRLGQPHGGGRGPGHRPRASASTSLVWLAFGLAGLVAMWSSASDGGRIARPRRARHAGGRGRDRRPRCSPSCPPPTWRDASTSPPPPGPAPRCPVAGGPGRRRPGGRSRPAGHPGRRRRGSAASWASPTASTPRCAARSATPWSCGSGPTGPRTGSARPSTPGTAQSWSASPTPRGSAAPATRTRRSSSRAPHRAPGTAQTDLQTFYVVQSSPNLVFHADTAHEVWFPTHDLFVSDHDSIVSPIGLGPGAIYTVESDVTRPSPDAAARPRRAPSAGRRRRSGARHSSSPTPIPRVQAAGRVGHRRRTRPPTTRSQSLIAWIGTHTHYSTDIPPLPPGAGHRRRVPLRQPHRVLRADLHRPGGDAALHRHPGPRGGRVRAGALQPDHRPLRRPGQGRPRLGPGVVPRATAGRASTPPPWSRWPTRRRGRPCCTSAGRDPAAAPVGPDRRSSSAWRRGRDARRRAAPAPAAAPGPTRRRAASSAAGRRAGRRRRPDETLTEYAAALDALAGDRSGHLAGPGRRWWRPAPTGAAIPRPRTTAGSWRRCAPCAASCRAAACWSAPGAAQAGRCASASSKLAPASSRGRYPISWRGRLKPSAAVSRPARP